mmetsp:Transcript_123482/g.357039  ORF Transcript_123482/g.357039 Transcript_123482/m.357039 type:complete len:229 (-) Transcript_123482:140-826(-)
MARPCSRSPRRTPAWRGWTPRSASWTPRCASRACRPAPTVASTRTRCRCTRAAPGTPPALSRPAAPNRSGTSAKHLALRFSRTTPHAKGPRTTREGSSATARESGPCARRPPPLPSPPPPLRHAPSPAQARRRRGRPLPRGPGGRAPTCLGGGASPGSCSAKTQCGRTAAAARPRGCRASALALEARVEGQPVSHDLRRGRTPRFCLRAFRGSTPSDSPAPPPCPPRG